MESESWSAFLDNVKAVGALPVQDGQVGLSLGQPGIGRGGRDHELGGTGLTGSRGDIAVAVTSGYLPGIRECTLYGVRRSGLMSENGRSDR